ncbi:Fpg/Nei family DNA glycosylase [Desulfosporosinus sp. BICA1-9]|uniref:Fpg/Nei family DNA glycosylase n=1 Tax=Desulfosporosinus sp. BICA1-9 TaxID=1531958 RepID=UPI00054C3B67|nr:DNA-formamidopyrimidine glycosylase family protein [Desulfosporosinus sp. BICA1-9]KJS46884.1 MAG: formamidopyrimidine-DNA glycosylase [Peptococcaceae bacterium BRH_c23]KJS83864.1 MAG: formamidopyrimidine-DNA glycosylase [Desulfosporosinus sp. BICA1-9]HBW38705.1 Fpg/Nei family DNA glycosylase [Desulfosporosinus sp.]
MPEIPEMEIYKDYLNKWVKDKRISEVNVLRVKSVNLESTDFCRIVIGKRIKDITRRGKYIIFHLDDGHFLLTHMMLDGRLFLLPLKDTKKDQSIKEVMSEVVNSEAENLRQRIKELPEKPSVIFGLSDDSVLFFCRLTLGYLHYLRKDELETKLGVLGNDPLDPNFDAQEFIRLLKGKKGMIKPWLMNPKNIAGVGNAYSNEALFGAGILPNRLISTISIADRVKLYDSLINILRDSIRLGGDMEEPFAPWDDFTGGYNSYFKVYDRSGKPCSVCQNVIEKSEVGGRNAFFCSLCQQ